MTGFPVLVTIESPANQDASNNLRYVGNGGNVKNVSGYDIAFTDAGGTPLYHEVEQYDPASGTLVAWVRVPVLSASVPTVIYVVYGDSAVSTPTQRPSGVWDGNFKGVWHLNQAPTNSPGEILDSTANANHGQSINMEAGDGTTGRIGNALQFDGVSEYIRFGGDDLEITGNITVEFWIHPDNISVA